MNQAIPINANIFQIPRPNKTNFAYPFLNAALKIIDRAFLLDRLNEEYASALLNSSPACFEDKILARMGVKININDLDIEKIPANGPLVIVSNHPFGAIEGIILSSIIRKRRPDYKIIANYLLGRIPELNDRFLLVNPFDVKNAVSSNVSPMKSAIKILKNGGAIAAFPSGEVSSFNLKTQKISDPEWNDNIARIAKITGAQVVTVFFNGSNSPLFQAAGVLHPTLRTALLPKEFMNKKDSVIDVRIGAPISAKKVATFPDPKELTAYLRFKTYLLGREFEIKKIQEKKNVVNYQAKIANSPLTTDLIKEIEILEDAKLVSAGDYSVYCVKARQAPYLMRELGIAREETFRAVGEGTGLSMDLDEFDDYYYHLLLWNAKDNKLAGAYRIGQSDEIVLMKGVSGLYTSTLFKYSEKMFDKIKPALELGRSFVRKEYQRSFAPLFMLWKAIGEFIGNNPKYTKLFGPVSVSKEYSHLSQKMLLEYLSINKLDVELNKLVKPRNPAKFKKTKFDISGTSIANHKDFDRISSIISEIESDGKSAPTLLKQYLKIGGKIMSFNRDPLFSDVLDALIIVDLTKSSKDVLEKYFSQSALNNFFEFNNL